MSRARKTTILLAGACGLLGALVSDIGGVEPAPDTAGDREAASRATATTQASSPGDVASTTEPSSADIEGEPAYLRGQVIVAPQPGVDLDALASRYDAEVIRAVGGSGYGVLSIVEAEADAALVRALRADPDVFDAAPHGRILGAGKGGNKPSNSTTSTSDAPAPTTDEATAPADAPLYASTCPAEPWQAVRSTPEQWHLDEIAAPFAGEAPTCSVVVAVIDSGVSYDNGSADPRRVGSLTADQMVAPWDFVDGDADPADAHQHGTHIASVIASSGAVDGVASGVTLMPVRVLDAANAGREIDLIDGLYHAIDNGADVINLSLSYPIGYVPSRALVEALDAATSAGIVVVAAAGNNGADVLTWPAAHPDVIAVGSYSMNNLNNRRVTGYSNVGASLDIVAPGGDFGEDFDGDGYIDGVLAETTERRGAAGTGLFFFQGTSQAAAQVTGAVALLLEQGAQPAAISPLLQVGSQKWSGQGPFSGDGSGMLDLADTVPLVGAVAPRDTYYVSLNAALVEKQNDPTQMTPWVTVEVWDHTGQRASQMDVVVSMWSPSGAEITGCYARHGDCSLNGGHTDRYDAQGAQVAAGWLISVDAVVDADGVAHHPQAVFHATDALEILFTAIDQAGQQDALLAFEYQAGSAFGRRTTVESYAVMNAGTGLSSVPSALLFTPSAIAIAGIEAVDLDLDGTGLATSPMGFARLNRVTIDGSGLATSPMGFTSLNLLAIDGSGFALSPLGFSSATMFSSADGGADSGDLSFTGSMVSAEDGVSFGPSLTGSSMEAWMVAGGDISESGLSGTHQLVGSGAVDVGMDLAGGAAASSYATGRSMQDGATTPEPTRRRRAERPPPAPRRALLPGALAIEGAGLQGHGRPLTPSTIRPYTPPLFDPYS